MKKTPEFLQDVDGAGSSKRVAAFWALGLLSLVVVGDLIVAVQAARAPSEFVVNALMVIITGGFLTIVAERLAVLRTPPQPEPPAKGP